MKELRTYKRTTGYIILDPDGEYLNEFETKAEALKAYEELLGKMEIDGNKNN